MFGNFFKKGRMEENREADAGYVRDAASSLMANVGPGGKGIEQIDQASLLPKRDGWADQRAPEKPGARILSLKAHGWLRYLPQGVRPHNLANRYPRICNHIAESWEYRDQMIRSFDALLTDARGGRQGFPLTIEIEIAGLKEHYLATGSATKGDVWD